MLIEILKFREQRIKRSLGVPSGALKGENLLRPVPERPRAFQEYFCNPKNPQERAKRHPRDLQQPSRSQAAIQCKFISILHSKKFLRELKNNKVSWEIMQKSRFRSAALESPLGLDFRPSWPLFREPSGPQDG